MTRLLTPLLFSLLAIAAGRVAAEPVDIAAMIEPAIEFDTKSIASFTLTNPTDRPRQVELQWSLQLDSQLVDAAPPDPLLGIDHAVGAVSSVSIDGTSYGDAMLTDGDEHTAFESPWRDGYGDAIVDVDLRTPRRIEALHWTAADANWIWSVDVSASLDGQTFTPIESLQGFDMHKKWGAQQFPLAAPFEARYLRLRFYKPTSRPNIIRLPASLHIYDGAANDRVEPPTAGPVIAEATLPVQIPSRGTASASIQLPGGLRPGAYLLAWQDSADNASKAFWVNLFVMPTAEVDKDFARRFGINASQVRYAGLMSRCGFGWVRFENAKWMMFSDTPGRYAFDGSIGPWYVNQDAIYETYQRLNMKILPYIFQTPEYATSAGPEITENRQGYPPRRPEDYGEAVFQLVARYGSQEHPASELKTADHRSALGRIDAVELWNEPNLEDLSGAAFVGPLEEYFRVMRAGAEAARRADPDLPVSSAGWAGLAVETVDRMRTHRYPDGTTPLDLVDIVNVHFYSGREEPEVAIEDPNLRGSGDPSHRFPQQVDALVKWRDRYKPSAELWLTETGNDVGGPIGLSERKQAAKLPRVLMIALSRGIDKAFIYRESGSKASMHAGAGLLRDDGSLRPSWFTVATLIRQLQGFDGPARRIAVSDPNVWLLLWRDADHCVLAAWTIGKPAAIPIDYPRLLREGAILRSVDAFGYQTSGERLQVSAPPRLGQFPIYLHLRPDSPAVQSLAR